MFSKIKNIIKVDLILVNIGLFQIFYPWKNNQSENPQSNGFR